MADNKPTEFSIKLANGYTICSGWNDADDPNALLAGDYLSVLDHQGRQVFYEDSADILADPIVGRVKLCQFILACLDQLPDTPLPVSR